MFKRILTMTAGLFAALVLLLAVNVLAGATLRAARVDLTENKLYTLSEGTKAVLSKVEEPITLRLYFSKKLAKDYPPLPDYFRRVEELLLEYVHHSGGKLVLEVLDPEPFTEIEDRAVQYGLQGVPVPGGDTLYFGLAAVNTIGDEEVVPFFQPDPQKEAFLEYDLTKLVHRLSNPERLTIGVLSTLPIEGQAANPFMQQEMPQPWFIVDQLRQMHETLTVMPTASVIPDEVGVLMVVHPKDLPEATLYAIDQFVLRGGKVIAFVDPYCEEDVPPQDPQNPLASMMAPRASTLGPLFDAWGIELADQMLAGDRLNALSVTVNNQGRQDPVPYVLWLGLGEESFNEEEVASRDLKEVRFGTAGILRTLPEASTTFTPLIQTSPESMEINVSAIQFQPDPPALLADFFPTKTPLTLAARVTGPARSAFPGGRPAPPEGAEQPAEMPEHVASTEQIHVVVVSDADMLADRWWIRVQNLGGLRLGSKTADNGDFLTNLLDVMLGSTDMISLRGRGGSTYPFEVVAELEREAEQAFRTEERRLTEVLDNGQRRINELQSKKEGDNLLMLSPEQEAEIERLIEEQIATRKRLREVRSNLRKDVEALGRRLTWLNMGAVPGLVLIFALAMVVFKVNRRSAS